MDLSFFLTGAWHNLPRRKEMGSKICPPPIQSRAAFVGERNYPNAHTHVAGAIVVQQPEPLLCQIFKYHFVVSACDVLLQALEWDGEGAVTGISHMHLPDIDSNSSILTSGGPCLADPISWVVLPHQADSHQLTSSDVFHRKAHRVFTCPTLNLTLFSAPASHLCQARPLQPASGLQVVFRQCLSNSRTLSILLSLVL